jgi:predicted nucleotidyltransferase
MSVAVSEDPVLREIVARLVRAVDPDRIILFGSRASGTARADSDYDVLIIKDEPDPSKRRTGKLYHHLWGIPAGVDLLWYTQNDIEQWSDVPQHVLTQAVRRGIAVYEKQRR